MITFPTPFQPVPFLALPQKEIKNGLSFSGAFALPPPLAARYLLLFHEKQDPWIPQQE